MSKFRVYIKPFKDDGTYGDFVEVTGNVDARSISTINREIDSTEYNAGVFKFSNFSIVLSNEHGKYSDVDVFQSIFRYKRTDSVIKITWTPNAFDDHVAGLHVLTDEDDLTIFEGLINDKATTLNIKKQNIKFQCLGYESLFEKMEVPFASLSVGDTFEEIIYDCLNQSLFTQHVTVSTGNISTGTNTATDAIADLENKTVKEALDILLIHSNSVLYIDNNILYVTTRAASASLQYTFYGQASNIGTENIVDISNVRTGLNRVFNLWTWQDTALFSSDASSKDLYGVSKKEIETSFVTNTTKRNTILGALKDEFKNPKQELNITTGINYTRFQLNILDKIKVDYPTVFVPADDNDLPIWGKVSWGNFKYPLGEWSITLTTDVDYKIIGIKYSIKSGKIIFKIREV